MDVYKSTFVSRLSKIRELNGSRKGFVNKDLYKLLFREESLVAGYEKSKSNKESTTPAVGDKTLDGFNVKRLSSLSKSLSTESWSPSPASRVYTPKPGKVEKRPLGIQGPEERVVQSTMTLILDAIYEPVFSPNSYGSRPRRGAHDALRLIDTRYDGMTFAIEGKIKGMYDNVNHHKLVFLLQKKISDDRFIRLVWKFLRAGYMDSNRLVTPQLGAPQGSIVSPILANIYLHELDMFMAKRSHSMDQRNPKVRTPDYKRLDNRMRVIKHNLPKMTGDQRRDDLRGLRAMKLKSLGVRMCCDPSERIVYTRYADDFIVGLAGSRGMAEGLKEEMRVFLEDLSLTLSDNFTKLTDIRKEHATFLGHRISIDTPVKHTRTRPKGLSPHLKRVTNKLVMITAPIETIVRRLHGKGFCDPQGKPTYKALWSTQEDNQIINLYNVTARGVFGYYSGVKKRHNLQRINYIFRFSCALTLAFKHRVSLAKVFNRYGRRLTITYGIEGEKRITLYRPGLKESSRRWQVGRPLPDPYRHVAARLAKAKVYEDCCICGDPSAEMHHL